MVKHLPVAVDGKEPSLRAVREAGEVAATLQASITLLTAFDLTETATHEPPRGGDAALRRQQAGGRSGGRHRVRC
ncbi:MAG: universal stress protein [Candidatus Dormibacteraceae bacterium]